MLFRNNITIHRVQLHRVHNVSSVKAVLRRSLRWHAATI